MTTIRTPEVPSGLRATTARWDDLCLLDISHRAVAHPGRRPGWERSWGLDILLGDGVERVPVADVRPHLFDQAQPVRRFAWRTGQRHRPGLQHMVSLGVQVGFESLQEQRLLLAVDFDGSATDVLSQPFRLRWLDGSRWRTHVPDYLLRTARGVAIVNVRPGGKIEDDDRENFAACDEMARHHGWRHEVVSGWVQPAFSVVDTLSAHRRPMTDRLGLRRQVLDALQFYGEMPFGDLAEATSCPAIARALILGMLWHKELDASLTTPLGDATIIKGAP